MDGVFMTAGPSAMSLCKVEDCSKRLVRAEKLISGLGGPDD